MGGAEHNGTRISFADLSHTGEAAEAFVKKHPACSGIVVRYDPRCPDESILEPGKFHFPECIADCVVRYLLRPIGGLLQEATFNT